MGGESWLSGFYVADLLEEVRTWADAQLSRVVNRIPMRGQSNVSAARGRST